MQRRTGWGGATDNDGRGQLGPDLSRLTRTRPRAQPRQPTNVIKRPSQKRSDTFVMRVMVCFSDQAMKDQLKC